MNDARAAEEAEAFRWEDAARAWVASALAPRRADGDRRLSVATVARVAVADGTVVDVHAVDQTRAVRMGADPPPEPPLEPPTEALLADGRTAEETPDGGGSASAAAAAAAAAAAGRTRRRMPPRAEPPPSPGSTAASTPTSRPRPSTACSGRYGKRARCLGGMCSRTGRARRSRSFTATPTPTPKSAAATGREPAPALPRRRGRPPTAPRANSGVSGSAFLPGPGDSAAAAKRRRRRGASARGDGAFAVANVAADDDEDVSEEEDEETLFSSGPNAGRPERPASVPPARKTVVLPAVPPRARRGPDPGATYDLHASFAECVAGTSALSSRATNGEETFFPDADHHLGEVVPSRGRAAPPTGADPVHVRAARRAAAAGRAARQEDVDLAAGSGAHHQRRLPFAARGVAGERRRRRRCSATRSRRAVLSQVRALRDVPRGAVPLPARVSGGGARRRGVPWGRTEARRAARRTGTSSRAPSRRRLAGETGRARET